ncbi:MAG: type I polyketide synthase, partial [bacterium]|nr:type I polyketide synthase [bacterium]
VDYLLRVLRGAVASTAEGGRIFVGDVRSLPLLEMFCASVELARADGQVTLPKLRERIRHRLLREEELVIAPAFFVALMNELPRVTDVRIWPKDCHFQNEMTRFRYDLVLHLDREPPAPAALPRLDWHREGLDLAALRQHLEAHQGEAVGLTGIPNARLTREVELRELLPGGDGMKTVGDLRRALEAESPAGSEPDFLPALARDLGYEIEVSWRRSQPDGSYDVLLWPAGEARPAWPQREHAAGRPLSALTNDPLHDKAARRLTAQLRGHLKERLPASMHVQAFVLLEALPLGPSGKVDRRALPAPEDGRRDLGAYVAPRHKTERVLAAIWQQLLGLEEIGVHDN